MKRQKGGVTVGDGVSVVVTVTGVAVVVVLVTVMVWVMRVVGGAWVEVEDLLLVLVLLEDVLLDTGQNRPFSSRALLKLRSS